MGRRRARIGLGLAIALVAAWGVAGTATAADQAVTIAGFAFGPETITVTAGDTVTWSNSDTVGHTATAGDGSFDTGTISGGASASVTFDTAGTYAYACTIHPTMTGTVVVEAAAPAPTDAPTAAPTAAPDGPAVTPAATDTDPLPMAHRTDVIGSIALLLAVFGVSMLVGTFWTSRRGRR